jgi:hypothetical protein
MVSMVSASLRLADHAKLCKFLDTYEKAFVVGADNVGSQQFQDIRKARAREQLVGSSVHGRRSLGRSVCCLHRGGRLLPGRLKQWHVADAM